MSGEIEAAGAMATAGLAASAIEGREAQAHGDGVCLNCGAVLSGAYCSACGQAAHPHRSLAHVFEEFLHGLLHFDTKAWRTLPMVAFRPGTLTRNYVYGKRARYISPLALFLFCVFFMFFAFAFIEAPVNFNNNASPPDRASAVEDLERAREELAQARRELEEAQSAPAPTDGTPDGLEQGLAAQALRLAEEEVQRRQAAIERIDAQAASEAAREAQSPQAEALPPADTARGEAPIGVRGEGGVLTGETRWQDELRQAVLYDRVEINMGHPKLNEKAREALLNPDLALYKAQQAAYKFSFLLVPLSLPFIALLFAWKRGVTFYDHVVYALYALSFASLLFVVTVALAQWEATAWVAGALVGLALPAHTFFHLGGAYKLGWFSALWRTFFMLIFATIILSLFLTIIIVLGLVG